MLVIKCYSCGVSRPFDGEISTRKNLEEAIVTVGFTKLVDDYRSVAVCGPKCGALLLTKRGQLLKRLPEPYKHEKK